MRRSICTCEPAAAYAGDCRTWKFIYQSSTSLPQGTLLLFDTCSYGRPIDWETPTTDLKKTKNVIWASIEGGKPIPAKEIEHPESDVPRYLFELPKKVTAGSPITIFMGDPKDKKNNLNDKGTSAQTNAQRRRPFFLYIDPTGKKKFGEPETFVLDIKGGELTTIKAITPSFVEKNKRFDIIIRFEDEHGNLTGNNDGNETLIELTHENIRENLSWKLFIPETGYITLPNLYFNDPGVYTITLKNAVNGEIFKSPPIRCFTAPEKQLLWGTFHGESERYDSTENIESCLRHFRDELAHGFYGVSPFESTEETPNETWKAVTQNIAEFDEEERFSTFTGSQWEGDPGTEGSRIFLFSKDQKQPPRKKDAKFSSLKKVYKAFQPKEMISIPAFTMGKGHQFNFDDFNPEFERVVEIYNAWGSSECSEKEGNPIPIKPEKKKGVAEAPEGSIINALKKNCRFGFVAGGLDDRGLYYDFYDNEQTQYPPGLTAVLSKAHTKEAIFDALQKRQCYATTGERIVLGFDIAGTGMGTEINTGEKPGLMVNRHITGYVAGTDRIAKVEIIRNGEVIHTLTSNTYHIDFTFDDMTPMEKHAIKTSEAPPFVFYYLRATQEDGHMAWSSPIWIDLLPPVKKELKKKTAVKGVD